MNNEILKLVKECGGYYFADGQGIQFTGTELEAFYRAAEQRGYNAGLERAAIVGWLAASPDCEDKVARAIRKMKEEK